VVPVISSLRYHDFDYDNGVNAESGASSSGGGAEVEPSRILLMYSNGPKSINLVGCMPRVDLT
jgi:hypothetical protein